MYTMASKKMRFWCPLIAWVEIAIVKYFIGGITNIHSSYYPPSTIAPTIQQSYTINKGFI